MYTSRRKLTNSIKLNLIAKMNAYINRSEDDRHKVMIFTDNADLWKDNANVIIRTDVPLPPIPKDYDRTRAGYDLVDEMGAFIGDYILPSSYDRKYVHWCVHDSGDENKPRAHVIFAPRRLEGHESVLLKSSVGISEPTKWRHLSDVQQQQQQDNTSVASSYCSSVYGSDYSTTSSEESVDDTTSEESEDNGSDSSDADPASNLPAIMVQRATSIEASTAADQGSSSVIPSS